MVSLTSLPVLELLDAFSSSEPLPAGGSASALTGAIGTSLLMMVAGMSKTRTGAAAEASALAGATISLRPVRDALIRLVQDDSDAYAALLTAMRAPRATDDERASRQELIVSAMHRATEVPLHTMRESRAALGVGVVIAEHGARVAAGDVAAAVELLRGAVRAAGHSVDSNLSALRANDFVERVEDERRRLDADSARDAAEALAALAR